MIPFSDTAAADDKSVWESLQRGEAAALRVLFERYHGLLLQDAYRLTADREAAQDIVQEVFLEIWKKHGQLHIQYSVKAYLKKAVLNRSLNFVRSRRRWLLDLSEQEMATAENEHEHIETLREAEEQDRRVREAIEALPEKCRLVFVLSRFEKMSHKEIAHALDISVKTIENQITKAFKLLRESLL